MDVYEFNAKVIGTGILSSFGNGEVTITVLKSDQVWIEICWNGDCKAIAIPKNDAKHLFKKALNAIEEG